MSKSSIMVEARTGGPAASERAGPAEVCVWRVALDAPGFVIARAESLLSTDERDRASQYRFLHRRRMFVVARAGLRMILGQQMGTDPHALRFQYNAHGKPSLVGTDGEVRFNVSHSGAVALVAVGRGREVGVDVEHVRPVSDPLGIARRFFAPPEVAWLVEQRCEYRDRAFLLLWARKEACLKAIGRGLLMDPASLDVTAPPVARLVGSPAGAAGNCAAIRFRDVHLDEAYVAAVATPAEDFSLVIRAFDFRGEVA